METEKSIKVVVNVVVNQAQEALRSIATETQKTTAQLEKMGAGAKKGADEVAGAAKAASSSSQGFFDSTTKGVLKGIASYDLLKTATKTAFGFLKESFDESLDASAQMAQVKTNIDNAGLSYEKLSKQIQDYSNAQIKMGFDDEDTALSVSRLALATGSYSDALKLNQISMDLARSKNISLADATNLVTQVTQGNGRVLKQYGISLDDSASAAENLDKLQQKLAGSAAAFADTAAGKIESVSVQWRNMKEEVGNKLAPVISAVFSKFQEYLPKIIALSEGVADTIGSIVKKIAEFEQKTHVFSNVWDILSKIETAVWGVGKAIFSMADSLGVFTAMGKYLETVAGAIDAIDAKMHEIIGDTEAYAASQMMLSDGMKSVIEDWNKLHDKAQITEDDFKQMSGDQQVAITKSVLHARSIGDLAKVMDAASDSTKSLKAGFEGVNTQSQEDQAEIEKQKQKMEELSSAFDKVTSKSEEFSFQSEDDFKRFSKLLADTKLNQDKWVTSVSQGFDAFRTATSQVNKDLDSLNDKLVDTKKSFADFVTSTTQGAGDDFAKIVHDAEQAIPDLQKQIQDAQAQGDDTSDLQKQLADKQSIIQSAQQQQYQSNAEFVSELAFLRSQDGKNELDQAYAVFQQKLEIKKKETDEEIAQIEEQIAEKQKQQQAYETAQLAMSKAFAENVAIRQGTAKKEIASIDALTDSLNAAANAYLNMAAAAAAAASAKASSSVTKRASGGPVASGASYLVGEYGPELFTPSQSGNITPSGKSSGGGSVTININNPSVRSDQDLSQIVQMVEDAMSRRDELARMGAYK